VFDLSYFHSNLLVGLFTNDSAAIAAGAEYLSAYAIDCLFTVFIFCFVGYFNGCGYTKFVILQGITGAFLFKIPFIYFISHSANVTLCRIALAAPLSSLIQVTMCLIMFIHVKKLKKSRLL